ncbi:MAG TPA: O-antigen ligase family protein [Verrucomicrobiae bacterium]|nr:O-antigen ligase family protein [Verrucomicrobiae bacterium]
MKFSEIINDQQLATEAIRRWITVAVCVAIALLTAIWIASGQFFMLTLLASLAVTAFVTAGLQRNAWVLIPLTWTFKGTIHALPLPLRLCDLVILLVTFSYIAQRVLGQTTRRSRGVLGVFVMLNLLVVGVSFMCHPVGLRALGSETMGGRPYFNIAIAFCAYWVIVHLPESYKQVARIPMWLMASVTFSAAVSALVYISPSITPYVWFFNSDVDISGYLGSLNPTETGPGIHRIIAVAPFGVMLTQFLAAYCQPHKFLNPSRWQFYVFLLAIVAVLASGFRNSLAMVLASVVLAGWFHRGLREVLMGGLLGVAFIAFLCFGQSRLFDLPLPAQRALGSFPGLWDEQIAQEVKVSNGRWDWWQQLLQEGFVKNWWIGDGIGVSEADFNLITTERFSFAESASVTGNYHNGPLTTIHHVGLVGLVLFYSLMITSATCSVKLVNRCRGTPLFPAAMFLAIQLCWVPVHFTFLFGSYDLSFSDQLFQAGLLTLLWDMSGRQPPSTEPAATPRTHSRNNRATLPPL